ncbi:AF4/FMR2 family member 4-like [Sergentomyia squamirostris]
MSYNPKPLQVSTVPSSDSQQASNQPPISQPSKVNPPPPPPQITQAVNNLHVLAAAGGGERLAQLHLQQQMASFQTQALLYQQQAAAVAAASSQATSEPLALTRVVADAAAKQANGSVTITPQPVASSATQAVAHTAASLNPNVAHQVHTTSLKMTYHVQHKAASTSQTPAHLSSQPASVQHHQTASVATVSQTQAQHHPGSGQPPPPPPSQASGASQQQKVPSPQKAAPPPATRAPQVVATSTAAQSQLQANNNVPKTVQQKTPPAAQPAPAKLATVVTPSKTTMKPATVTTPRIKQTARKNQTALSRPQSNFAAAVEAAAVNKPSTSAASTPETSPAKAPPPVAKTTPSTSAPVEKEKPVEKQKTEPKEQVKKEKPQQKTTKMSSSSQDTSDSGGSPLAARFKRSRTRTVPYQSPLPEYALLSKLSYAESSSSGSKTGDDRLVLFYKSEFLAVRNAEGGFFLCQAQHNVYKSSPRIRIQWLSEEKPNSTMYIPDFYDVTDLECILTSVELQKKAKKLYKLPEREQERIQNILRKAIDVEKGILPRPNVTEENPDGLDLSLYKDESQLERHSRRKRGKSAAQVRSKRTKVDTETPKRASTRTTSPRKNFAESDFDMSDEEDDEPLKGPKSQPLSIKTPTAKETSIKATPVKKTPISSPAKAPAKSKVPSPKQSVQPTAEVVVPESPLKGKPGRKRKAELIMEEEDPLALPPPEKKITKSTPDTPAAAKMVKAPVPAKKSPQTPVAQSTKKAPVGKAKKIESPPEVVKKTTISSPQAKITPPKAKVLAAAKLQSKGAAGGRTTRGRK